MGKRHHRKSTKLDSTQSEEKSLKLVLKVGSPEMAEPITTDDSERRHKHKKKKKKRSSDKEKHRHHHHHHRHHGDDKKVKREEEDTAEPPMKRASPCRKDDDDEEADEKTTLLQRCLGHLHEILQRKDPNGFFAFPVTDSIAPGYSSIITHPTDFSTMKTKIDDNVYQSVSEYRSDFLLMCDNCMQYNHPDTIYYKEAKKLQSIGMRVTSKDKLAQLKKNYPEFAELTAEHIGINDDVVVETEAGEDDGVQKTKTKTTAISIPSTNKFEAIAKDMSPEDILDQAEAAAKDAAARLAAKNPHGKMGYLSKQMDGTTKLMIINPDNSGIVSETERVVNLGELTGKLSSGLTSLNGFKEDKRNKATPIHYLDYGPLSSYGPIYDSSASNLSKHDSDLFLSTYGDELGIQYAKSIQAFSADCDDYVVNMVDRLLDTLTWGEHTKTLRLMKEKEEEERKLCEEEEKALQVMREHEQQQQQQPQTQIEEKSEDAIDYDSLRSLADLGIDMSFLDNIKSADQTSDAANSVTTHESSDLTQTHLDESCRLICDLQAAQNDRLSKRQTTEDLGTVPSAPEIQLANAVSGGLSKLVKQVAPGDITSVGAIRSAMGVPFNPDCREAIRKRNEQKIDLEQRDLDDVDSGSGERLGGDEGDREEEVGDEKEEGAGDGMKDGGGLLSGETTDEVIPVDAEMDNITSGNVGTDVEQAMIID